MVSKEVKCNVHGDTVYLICDRCQYIKCVQCGVYMARAGTSPAGIKEAHSKRLPDLVVTTTPSKRGSPMYFCADCLGDW